MSEHSIEAAIETGIRRVVRTIEDGPLAGMQYVLDPRVPRGEIHFKYGDRVVGKITDIGEAHAPREVQP